MKKITRLTTALFAAFTLATQFPASASPTNYTILDSYTGDVPTGTSYQELEYYNQYVDAGSVDASPFVIDKTTANSGGILFYGSTELISGANANTFRLTSSTGAFDFTSFNLQGLETNQAYGTNTIPKLTITSSTGATQTWSASALPPPPPRNYTILDSYNPYVPTGTSYQPLTSYNQYVDAGSVDYSPFVLTKTTANSGGILFYGSTELISAANANTFRLTSTTGTFDFKSFNLQGLEGNDAYASTDIPKLTITSSTGATQTWSSTWSEFMPGHGMYSFNDSGEKTMNWSGVEWVELTTQYTKAKTSEFALTAAPESGPVSYSFDDSGVKTMNLSGVDWVDLTTQYTKAKTSDFVLTAGARPLGSFGDLAAGTTDLSGSNSTVAEVTGTATVNVSGTGTTIDNVNGGTVNANGAGTTIQSYNGGNVAVGSGLIVTINNGTSSGRISGAGGLAKAGSGTVTLTGNNTYTGATTVSEGKLVINGNISTSTLTTVDVGATIGGTGTVGATIINGTLAVGNSPGQMDFTNTLSLNGSTVMEIDGTAGAGVTGGHDFVNLTGGGAAGVLSYGGTMTIDIGAIFTAGGYSWSLFDMASETGTFASITLADQYSGTLLDVDLDGVWDLTSGSDTWQFTEATGNLSLTVIPEPNVAILSGGLGVLALLRRRR
jgi:autotransporter-associated beta strand protein